MKILFLCGREAGYPLNQFLIESLRQFSSVEVGRENGSGTSILRRSLRVFWQAAPKICSRRYDLIFVSFFGHFLMLPVGLLSKQPVVFHPFVSTYETLVFDRQRFTPGSLPARAAFWLDRAACHSATHLLLDTQANVDFFSQTFAVPTKRFSKVFIGSDERIFYPRPAAQNHDQVIVLFHGSYLPLQGIDVIIHAANLLKDHPKIHFRMVGRGPGYDRIHQLAQSMGLTQIEFLDSVPFEDLPVVIAAADICLGGHFGTSEKALRVIAGKTFQDIAMGKPTIVGDTPANWELLTHGYDAWFSTANDPAALAQGIKTLADDSALRASIGQQAHRTFMEKASLKVLVPEIKKMVEKLVQ